MFVDNIERGDVVEVEDYTTDTRLTSPTKTFYVRVLQVHEDTFVFDEPTCGDWEMPLAKIKRIILRDDVPFKDAVA